jgi:hypothetical protein
MEVLSEEERIEQLNSPDPLAREAAAHSFFNNEIGSEVRTALIAVAEADAVAAVRGRAWAGRLRGRGSLSMPPHGVVRRGPPARVTCRCRPIRERPDRFEFQ